MERMGFVMTKDAKAAKMFPPNSEEIKESYAILNGGGEQHSWDQRGMRMVPVNDWTVTTIWFQACIRHWSRRQEGHVFQQ